MYPQLLALNLDLHPLVTSRIPGFTNDRIAPTGSRVAPLTTTPISGYFTMIKRLAFWFNDAP